MQNTETFEEMLSGGHPNSLGRTLEVVEIVLKDKSKFEDLFNCYFSDDEVVRLRVSNAIKRVAREHIGWLAPYIDRFLDEISTINQASTQWTLAQLFLLLENHLSASQRAKAIAVMQRNLDENTDWIVQNTHIETLSIWAKDDKELRQWLIPRLEKLAKNTRKSVANRARKQLKSLR